MAATEAAVRAAREQALDGQYDDALVSYEGALQLLVPCVHRQSFSLLHVAGGLTWGLASSAVRAGDDAATALRQTLLDEVATVNDLLSTTRLLKARLVSHAHKRDSWLITSGGARSDGAGGAGVAGGARATGRDADGERSLGPRRPHRRGVGDHSRTAISVVGGGARQDGQAGPAARSAAADRAACRSARAQAAGRQPSGVGRTGEHIARPGAACLC
jgi:hypothetical protein